MAPESLQRSSAVWRIAREQDNVIGRAQLEELGFSSEAIRHRIRSGRLHRLWPGVYAVGTPHVTRPGWWMAAVLTCGAGAVLSHESAAALWRIREDHGQRPIEVSLPSRRMVRRRDIRVHRRSNLGDQDITRHRGIPVTKPATTLVDLAASLPSNEVEAAINAADKNDLIDPESLRQVIERLPRRPGLANLKRIIDRRTFRLTRSQLERHFRPIAESAGLGMPLTRQYVNGFEVDFYWPEIGLVIETDGLRYHRTPAQQARDRLRDQAHAAAGLTPLRFTHAQVKYQREHVNRTLSAVVRRLRRRPAA